MQLWVGNNWSSGWALIGTMGGQQLETWMDKYCTRILCHEIGHRKEMTIWNCGWALIANVRESCVWHQLELWVGNNLNSGCALIGDVRGQQLELFMNCKRNLAFIFYTHSFVYPPPSKFIHMLFLSFFLIRHKMDF